MQVGAEEWSISLTKECPGKARTDQPRSLTEQLGPTSKSAIRKQRKTVTLPAQAQTEKPANHARGLFLTHLQRIVRSRGIWLIWLTHGLSLATAGSPHSQPMPRAPPPLSDAAANGVSSTQPN